MGIRKTLLLLASLTLVPTTAPEGQAARQGGPIYTLSGIVRDGEAAPLASAELALSRGGERARLFRTGEDGRFSFAELHPGPMLLKVRRLGYRVVTMNVEVGPRSEPKELEVALAEIPSTVDAVIVEGSKGHLREFYDHKANSSFAKFFERKDIEQRNPTYLSELLRTVAGARLQASSRSGNVVLLRGCKPMVWVDGIRAPGAELDEVARPIDIAGIEVYPSSAGLPPQYQDRNNRMCGAIMVWTRNQ